MSFNTCRHHNGNVFTIFSTFLYAPFPSSGELVLKFRNPARRAQVARNGKISAYCRAAPSTARAAEDTLVLYILIAVARAHTVRAALAVRIIFAAATGFGTATSSNLRLVRDMIQYCICHLFAVSANYVVVLMMMMIIVVVV